MDNVKSNDIKSFLAKIHKLENCPIHLLNSLDQNLTALILKVNNIGQRNLKLTKTTLLKKRLFLKI
ncbi:hypothetical protein ACE5D9_02995 [Rickettsia sp. 2024-CO-Wats]|uniref:hypothetical protein n=1 Tax=unclassified Rickettsia TaxID=114295 RepID=UPI00370D04BA